MDQAQYNHGGKPMVEFDMRKYNVVYESLGGVNATISFDTSHHCLEQALQTLTHPETGKFLEKCLFSIVKILLDQDPFAIPMENQRSLEHTLGLANAITLHYLRSGSNAFIRVSAELINTEKSYYKGKVIRGYRNLGRPQLQKQFLLDFFANDGFKCVANCFKNHGGKSEAWLIDSGDGHGFGAIALISLLRGLNECLTTLKPDLVREYEEIASVLLSELPKLSELILKTDGVEALNSLIVHLREILEYVENEAGAFNKWLELTLHYLKSSSLPLRLMGCDQMEQIIRDADNALLPAEKYLVYGAGNDQVNGVYELSSETSNNSPKWTKVDQATNITITLFVCTVTNSVKTHWYLSEADPVSPGSASDIDYYRYIDVLNSKHPSLRKWLVCDGKGNKGIAPAPMLQVIGPMLYATESKASELLKIAPLLVDALLGSSMHREVVARSTKLFLFLTKVKALSKEHVEMLWKACLSSGEVELCDEILSLLAELCCHADSDTLIHFLNFATETTINEESGGLVKMGVKDSFRRNSRALPTNSSNINSGNSMSSSMSNNASVVQGQYHSVGPGTAMKLADKLASNGFLHVLPQPLEPKLLDAILGFVWGLVSLPPDSWSLNKQQPTKVRDMARYLLHSVCIDDSHHMKALVDCLSILRLSSNTSSVSLGGNKSSRTTASNASTGRQSPHMNSAPSFEEDDIIHTFSLARLVLENFPSSSLRRLAVDRLASEHGIVELLSAEISAWRKRRSSHFPIGHTGQRPMPCISNVSSPSPTSSVDTVANESPRVVTLAGAMSASSLSKSSSSSKPSATTASNTSKTSFGGGAKRSNVMNQTGGSQPLTSTLSSELDERLDLWACIFSASPLVNLGKQQLSNLWKLLQLPEEKESCLVFFRKALDSYNELNHQKLDDDEFSFSCFGEDEISFINSDLLGSDTDWTYLGENAYDCLRSFQATMMGFAVANRENVDNTGEVSMNLSLPQGFAGNQERALLDNIVMTDDEKCLDVIWSVFLKCNDSTVANMAMVDLINIYNNISFLEKLEIMQSRFLSRSIGYLQQSIVDLDLVDEYKMKIGGIHDVGGCDLGAVRLRIKRCIMILKSSVYISHGRMPFPHALRSSSNLIPVIVSGKRLAKRLNQSTSPFGMEQYMLQQFPIEPFVLHVHPLESFRSIRLRVRDLVAPKYPINYINLICQSQNVYNDELMVRDVNFIHGGKLFVQAQLKPFQAISTTENNLVAPVEGMRHLGEIICANDEFYSALFNLLKHPKLDDPMWNCSDSTCLTSKLSSSVSPSLMDLPTSITIWEFLLTLPTQTISERTVSRCCGHSYSASSSTSAVESASDVVSWAGLIFDQGASSWHHSVYFLQICESYLCPNPTSMIASEENGASSVQLADNFRQAFIRNGGLDQVLRFFMNKDMGAPVGTQKVLVDMAAMVTLRILKSCIFNDSQTQSLSADLISPLLERLVSILLKTHDLTVNTDLVNDSSENVNKCFGVHGLIEYALSMVTLLVGKAQNDALKFFMASSATTRDLVEKLLVLNKNSEVRSSMKLLCLDCFAPFAKEISFWLVDQLKLLNYDCSTCDELFNVLGTFVRKNVQGLDLVKIAQVVIAKLMDISEFASNNPESIYTESSMMNDDDYFNDTFSPKETDSNVATMLSGCLILLCDIMKLNPVDSLRNTELENSLIHVMIHKFLFTLPEVSEFEQRMPVCFSGGNLAIKSALKLLEVSSQYKHQDIFNVIEELSKLSQVCRDQLKRKWGVECSSDMKTNGIKFAGLINQGCTCYMNSTLQQLFMIKPLRKAIIEAKVKYERYIEGEKFTPVELVNRNVCVEAFVSDDDKDCEVGNRKTYYRKAHVHSWNKVEKCHCLFFEDENKETPTGLPMYAGPPVSFNLFDGRPGLETGKFYVNRVAESSIAPTKPLASDDATRCATHVLEQMQRTFLHLERTEKRCVDCRPLVVVSNCMQLEFNVFQQNDAPEFYDKLMHKLEDALKLTDKFSDYERCFGMQIVNQSIPREQTDRFKAREKADTIMKVELKVQGMDTIEESLSDFVKDELMDGDNKIEFENEANETAKLTGVRRTCLSHLPNILVLHLKRFDLDFNTFQTVKLNNRCSFPTRLNMKPYTKVGMEERDAEALKNEIEEDDEESRHETSTDSLMGSPPRRNRQQSEGSSTPVSPKTNAASIDSTDEGGQSEKNQEDDLEFLYELRGVLVHAGGSQSGHYYSFSKDAATGNWYKFDDDVVTLWNPEEMERECFGGTYQVTRGNSDKKFFRELTANALMVFYDKVVPNKDVPKTSNHKDSDSAMDDSNNEDAASSTNTIDSASSDENDETRKKSKTENVKADELLEISPSENSILLSGIEAYEHEVYNTNLKFRHLGYMFDKHLHDFLKNMLSGVSGIYTQASSSDVFSTSLWPSVVDSMNLSIDDGSGGSLLSVTSSVATNAPKMLSPLQLHVILFCISFFLDIILHSRERERDCAKQWVTVISDLFAAHPFAAACFLELLVYDESKHESWMKDYFLSSNDYFARCAFIELIEAAVNAVAPFEEASLNDEISRVSTYHTTTPEQTSSDSSDDDIMNELFLISMSGVRDESGNVVAIANHKTSSICVDFIRCVVAFLSPQAQRVLASNVGSSDEMMLLIRKLAEGHSLVRRCLVSHNVIAKLVYLTVLDDVCPSAARNDIFSYNKYKILKDRKIAFENKYEYHTSFDNIKVKLLKLERLKPEPPVEAINALLAVPQTQKVSLLTEININDIKVFDNGSNVFSDRDVNNWFDQSLTPEVQFVLSRSYYCICNQEGFVSMNELLTFFHSVAPKTKSISDLKALATYVLEKYGQETQNQKILKLDGFLEYYKQLALDDPKEVWSDLAFQGFRNDLTNADKRLCVSTLNSQTSKSESSFNTTAEASSVAESIPPASLSALASYSFCNLMLLDFQELFPSFLKRVCNDNREASITLISSIIQECRKLHNFADRFRKQRHMRQLQSLLGALLSLEDGLQSERLNIMFTSYEWSLVRFGATMNENVQAYQRQSYSGSMDQIRMCYILIKDFALIIQELYHFPLVQRYLDQESMKPLVAWLTPALQSQRDQAAQHNLDSSSPSSSAREGTLCPLTIVVTDSGYEPVNGTYYKRSELEDDAPCWENGQYMIYRCRLENNLHQWYLSLVPPNEPPGSDKDTDFYFASSCFSVPQVHVPYERQPPSKGWEPSREEFEPVPNFEFLDYEEIASDVGSMGARSFDDESNESSGDWSGELE